jgi:uncharacterized membrane protein
MPNESKSKPQSNVKELSAIMLLGGAALMLVGTRVRLLAAIPLWLLGAAATVSGASLRPEANHIASGVAGEDSLWVKTKSSVSVMKPTQEIYEFWRNPINWPKFMPDIDIEPSGMGTDRYRLNKRLAPGVELKQELLIVEDLPYHHIAWVSLGEDLPHRGRVEFTTNGGTYVTLTWEYQLAAGPAINAISKTPLRTINEVLLVKLQRFKQILETGGASTFGPTACRSSSLEILWYVLKSDANRAFADLLEPAAADA